ncbi:MFS transporter [Pseudonocardia sp. MH-G8]|uniref:MFS transporter n=1 Tax=Pseudonocardia sp. MH-G8 TaxID=1854588 RepID=UPI000BA0249B|nr:MFS transporter [Pseudonocardia sp. MH-G8]OZM82945.1 MFS transporter [Pseudonocardia sp. MH-G8]
MRPPPQIRRARAAVAALFFANGALFANVVPRYPDLKAALDLSNTALGTAVGAAALGGLLAGPVAGALVARFGSVRVAPISTFCLAGSVALMGVAPSWAALVAVLFLMGAVDSAADLAVNAHGLRVERRYGRSILNSMHGIWSVGAVLGGATGAAATGLGVPLPWHLAGAAVVFALLGWAVARFLLPGRDDHDAPARPDGERGPLRWRSFGPAVLGMGLIAAMAQSMEDAGATWSSLYLREDLGAAAAVGGLGFIALQGLQTVGRLLGDGLVTRFGDRAVALAGAALAAGAMSLALAVPTAVGTVIGFGAVGLGIGTLIPAAMRAADSVPGLPRGLGLALVGTVDRVALLAGPPLIGLVADAAGLRFALLVIPAAALVVLGLSPVLSGRRERAAAR